MIRPVLSLVASNDTPKPAQTSWDAALIKQQLAVNWSRFCLASFSSAEACANFFAVSNQCARNWMEGDVCRPSGHHVVLAMLRFGADLAPMLAEGAERPQLRRVA